jgi:hypothetical protein
MIVPIPEDIYSYRHKVWGNFSKRQLVCGVIALIIIFPVFIPVFWYTGSPRLAALLSVVAILPVLFCGIVEKDGQPLEKVIWYKYRQRFKFPQKRKFAMSNLYEIVQQNQKEYEFANEEIESQKQQKGKKGRYKCPAALDQKRHRTKQHPV